MKRTHGLFVIAAALVVGCRDAQTPSDPTPRARSIASPNQTLQGTVIANTEQKIYPALLLQLADGTTIGLDGNEARPLASVLGAQVQVDGQMDGDQAFVVSRFVVLAVGGSPVVDGVLESIADGVYSLLLTGGGARTFVDATPELAEHLGERVWLILSEDDGGTPTAFGVIKA
jgi:hypothetical protein